MTESSTSTNSASQASSDESIPTDAPRDFSTVARGVFRWTCNLLATGLVLIAAITFTKQVIYWWKGDAAQEEAARQIRQEFSPLGVHSPDLPLELEIGDGPSTLTRAEFTGDMAGVRKELLRLCEEGIPRAAWPSGPPGPAEAKMLAGLASLEPVRHLPDGCELYEQLGPIPMVAAVAEAPAGSKSPASAAETASAQAEEVAGSERRVVSWGIGVHLTGTRWMLLLLTSQGKPPAAGDSSWPVVELPPHAKRVLSLAVSRRESIVAFTGRETVAAWKSFFDEQLSATTSSATWQVWGDVWRKRFETPAAVIDIQLATTNPSDEIQGFLTIRAKHTGPSEILPEHESNN